MGFTQTTTITQDPSLGILPDPVGFGAGGTSGNSNSNIFGSINTRVYPPQVFSVAVDASATALDFLIGVQAVGFARFRDTFFKVYFTPVALVSASTLSDPTVQAAAFSSAVVVGSIAAPPKGGAVSFSNSQYYGQDGWFWATCMTQQGTESRPTSPFRAPVTANLVNLNVAPNVSGQAVSKTTNTVNGVTVSTIAASAVVPSDARGVTAVFVTNPGKGYTTATTIVTFAGGLLTNGVAATATAIVNSNGGVSQIVLSSTGQLYGSAPIVNITSTGSGTGATATAEVADSTAFDGFQLYLTNYLGGTQVEGPYFTASNLSPGQTAQGQFNLIPDGAHTTTFTFVSVSASGVRSLSGAPTATLVV